MGAGEGGAAALGGWGSSSAEGRWPTHARMETEVGGGRASGSDLDWIWEGEGGSGGWRGRGSELGFGWLDCGWDEG